MYKTQISSNLTIFHKYDEILKELEIVLEIQKKNNFSGVK
jgi:hypothetical protein